MYNLVSRKLSLHFLHMNCFHHLKALTSNLIFWIWQYGQFPSSNSLIFARLLNLQLWYVILIQICCNLFHSCPEIQISKSILQQTKLLGFGRILLTGVLFKIIKFAPLIPLQGLRLTNKYSQMSPFIILCSRELPFTIPFFVCTTFRQPFLNCAYSPLLGSPPGLLSFPCHTQYHESQI